MTKIWIIAAIALAIPSIAASADDGLVTKPSRHSVEETIDNFEAAINAQAAGGSFLAGSIMPPLPKRPGWTCARGRSSYSATPKRARPQ
jgi:hypothetical protein